MIKRAVLGTLLVAGLAIFGAAGCSDPTSKLSDANSDEVIKGLRQCAKSDSDEVAEKVAQIVNHQDEMVAAEAVRSLGDMRRSAKVLPVLRQVAAQDKRGAVRQEAVVQLGKQKAPEALDTLRSVVKADPDPRVRAAAATSLSRQRSLPDVALLVEIAENEQDPMVQSRAVGAVERLIGLKFGYDPTAPLAERKKALQRMRSIALTAAASLQQWKQSQRQN